MPHACDILIRNAMVIDGTGAARFAGNVAVAGDRIVAVGDAAGLEPAREIEAAGLALAPGFIDAHTHDDNALIVNPDMHAKVSQGVTTVVTGNCGVSLAPLLNDRSIPPPLDLLGGAGAFRYGSFAEYAAKLAAAPPAINAAPMIGHATLRVAVMQEVGRPANGAEIERMRALLREALRAGVIGFSTGLFYPPNRAATGDEIVALLELLAGTGAVYATHMRDEADGVEESLDESFETARRAGVPLVISHHKCMGKGNFGRSTRTLQMIDEARRRQPVGLDVYPYTAGSTVLLPELIDKAMRILVTWSKPHPAHAGRDLADVAAEWNVSAEEAMRRLSPGGAIYFMMDEDDVRRIMRYPHAMIGSDGLPHDEHPHPRLWGTFPRVLGHYVREVGLFGLEEAVHRMTGLPAKCFGLRDRGVIREGAFADIVLFDPTTIADRATFEDPKQPASGIALVVVSGAIVMEDGRRTGARTGRLLRRANGPEP